MNERIDDIAQIKRKKAKRDQVAISEAYSRDIRNSMKHSSRLGLN